MPDINLNVNGQDGLGDGEKNEALLDAPAKSPLEQSTAASANQAPPNPTASSAMPDANPASPIGSPVPAAPEQAPQDETAAVPDTDKFLESILENNNQPSPPPPPPVPDSTAGNGVPVGVNPSPADPTPPQPPVPEPAELPKLDESVKAGGEPPKIKDDIRGLDTVMNGITPPNEPSKPISDNPVSAMQAQKASGGSMKTILLLVLLVALGIGGYFAYTMMFKASTNTEVPTTTDVTTTEESPATAVTKSNDETRKENLAKIQVALKSYFSATGKYPLATELVKLNTPDNILEKELVGAGYITAVPTDPDTSKYYAYKSDGSTFSLTAVLDNAQDPEAKVSGALALYEITQDSLITTSPNSVTQIASPTVPGAESTVAATDESLNPFYPSGSSTAEVTTSPVSSTGADTLNPVL